MKKFIVLILIFIDLAICNNVEDKNEIVGYTLSNIPITKADMEWRKTLRSDYQAEWTKLVTNPSHCQGERYTQLSHIMTISTNILNQHPAIWLQGKYLEFVNSQCDLFRVSTIKTKEDFEKTVDKYLLSIRPTQLSKAEQEELLKAWKKDMEKGLISDILFGWIVPIGIFILLILLYVYVIKAIFSNKTTFFQKLILFILFFKGK